MLSSRNLIHLVFLPGDFFFFLLSLDKGLEKLSEEANKLNIKQKKSLRAVSWLAASDLASSGLGCCLQQPLEMTGNAREGPARSAGPRLVVLAGNALGAPGNRRGP